MIMRVPLAYLPSLTGVVYFRVQQVFNKAMKLLTKKNVLIFLTGLQLAVINGGQILKITGRVKKLMSGFYNDCLQLKVMFRYKVVLREL